MEKMLLLLIRPIGSDLFNSIPEVERELEVFKLLKEKHNIAGELVLTMSRTNPKLVFSRA
jgi:hypothetical protein